MYEARDIEKVNESNMLKETVGGFVQQRKSLSSKNRRLGHLI